MLIGQYSNKLGAKNRTALPKKFRNELGQKVIVSRGYEGCLVIVDEQRWEKIVKEVVDGTFIDKKIRDSGRFLLAGAHEVELDDQGRFVVPEMLVKYANLRNDIVFLGLSNWVEVWSADKWQEHEEYIKENGDQIAQELADVVRGQNTK